MPALYGKIRMEFNNNFVPRSHSDLLLKGSKNGKLGSPMSGFKLKPCRVRLERSQVPSSSSSSCLVWDVERGRLKDLTMQLVYSVRASDGVEMQINGSESVLESTAETSDEDLCASAKEKKKSKPVVIEILQDTNSVDKMYSDNYNDSCLVECCICDKQMPSYTLRTHTSQHHITISKYKDNFGSKLTLTRRTFHLCKLCGKEMLLDMDVIAAHVRSVHKWSLKQYNADFMKGSGKMGQ